MDTSFKRIIAYLIDFLIIIAISTVIASIPIINPYKDEYNKTYQKYTELQKDKASSEDLAKINYDLSKQGIITTSVSIILIFAYFGIYQYYNKGQTIGKKLLKIQVVSNDEKDIGIWHYIFRSIILNNIIFRVMIVLGLFIFNYKTYNNYSMIISFIENTIIIIIVSMVVLRKNNRGLHDILCRTKVISLKEDDKIIEAKVKN